VELELGEVDGVGVELELGEVDGVALADGDAYGISRDWDSNGPYPAPFAHATRDSTLPCIACGQLTLADTCDGCNGSYLDHDYDPLLTETKSAEMANSGRVSTADALWPRSMEMPVRVVSSEPATGRAGGRSVQGGRPRVRMRLPGLNRTRD